MWDWIQKAYELKAKSEPFATVTIIRVSGSAPRDVGAKMIVSNGEVFGTIGGGNLEHLAIVDARGCLNKNTNAAFTYPLGPYANQCCGGLVEIFVETVGQSSRVVVFGAGHVGQAVAQVLNGTQLRVLLVDERVDWVHSNAIPDGTERFLGSHAQLLKEKTFSPENTYFVVMTHSHDLDAQILTSLSKISTGYVGLIGSESKWNRFQARLHKSGVDSGFIEKVKCPIGQVNFGKSPKEVAISLAAELLELESKRIHQSERTTAANKVKQQTPISIVGV
jgi:xanthine dehydrogenase accessory factor